MTEQNIDVECINTFYNLLDHKKQTEIRAIELSDDFKKSKIKGHYFVSSRDEFIETVKELNGKYNVYAGVNERMHNGTEAKDVISIKSFFIDIDCVNKPSTQEDIEATDKIANQLIADLEQETGGRPTKIFSGNGFQFLYKIPEILIDDLNRNEIQNQFQNYARFLIKKYSNEKVKLDNVSDLPRIMRVTGTQNIKGKKFSKFVEIHPEENQKLKDIILFLLLFWDKI